MPVLWVLVIVAAMFVSEAARALETVPPQVLGKEWLDGRSVSTVGPRGGRSVFAFKPDGTLTRTGGRAGADSGGRWRLDDEGFCMTLGEKGQESCYVALRGEGGAIRVLRRSGAFTWTR